MTKSNSQLQLSKVKDLFNNYIDVFNEDYQIYLPKPDRKMHPISKLLIQQWHLIEPKLTIHQRHIDGKTMPMIELMDLVDVLAQQVQTLNQQKYYRIAILLNTISGDLQTSMAHQVICFADDGDKYWLLAKEPAQDNEGVYYYYSLTTEPDTIDLTQLFDAIQYVMTEDNIKHLLSMNDKLDGFVSLKQQRACIQNSILTQADFAKFDL